MNPLPIDFDFDLTPAGTERQPAPLPDWNELIHWSPRLTHALVAFGLAVGIALALHRALFWLLRRIASTSQSHTDKVVARRLYQPLRWALVAIATAIAGDADALLARLWDNVLRFVLPAALGWVVFALVKTFAEVMALHTESFDDELVARSRRTRIALLSRSAGFVIVIVTVALILLEIPGVRQIGATLIASAGIIGLAVGAAAQPVLKSLIAGMQIALTEPVRIGDFVVVDGESGRIEDIRLSYVVIRTTDERRFIVPTMKFVDSSFQNWTRVGGITGFVTLPIKPGYAIAPIREAYARLLAAQPDWDRRSGQLLISDARAGSIEIKLLMSAAEPGALGRLRSAMREAMLEWLRQEMPEALCDSG